MDRLIPKFLREAPQDEGSFNPILGGVVTTLTIAKESLNGIPLPGVQAAIGGLLEVFRRIIAMKANEKDLKDLLNTLGRLQSEIIDPLIELRKQEDLWSSIQGEIDALAEELGQSFNACQLMRKGKARSFMHAQDDTTAIAALNHGVEQAIQKFIVIATTFNTVT
ncbi:hypothetical protein FRC03_001952 [Tulasnella sp. 419]|nr:hypothetical protein FRC03_001952 [Tulasnella sp. 419]